MLSSSINFLCLVSCSFESDTDTEVIAKLVSHIHSQHPEESFQRIVEQAIQQLEGAFACAFKSRLFPGELVATRRGSPLIVGIRTPHGLDTDHIPVQYRWESPDSDIPFYPLIYRSKPLT